MRFDVAADAYDRFMGRYSVLLSPQLADLAGVAAGQRVLDVGCGPGALTAELVDRSGRLRRPRSTRRRRSSRPPARASPGSTSGSASAEQLPFADDSFDAALAQLVVHFMTDPAAGVREMARVTGRPARLSPACGITAAGRGR